jgi:two-component system response regulator
MREYKLILIEDSEDDAELTIGALRNSNKRIIIKHLRDGEEALHYINQINGEQAKGQKQLPSLFLIDIKMPKINGIEFLKELKANSLLRGIPAIIFTSSSELSDISNAYSVGANSYVIKPLDFSEFLSTVSGIENYWLNINQQLN